MKIRLRAQIPLHAFRATQDVVAPKGSWLLVMPTGCIEVMENERFQQIYAVGDDKTTNSNGSVPRKQRSARVPRGSLVFEHEGKSVRVGAQLIRVINALGDHNYPVRCTDIFHSVEPEDRPQISARLSDAARLGFVDKQPSKRGVTWNLTNNGRYVLSALSEEAAKILHH